MICQTSLVKSQVEEFSINSKQEKDQFFILLRARSYNSLEM